MIDVLVLQRFLIALALGALIGLEREYARHRQRGHDYAGIRTFPLISLFGALAAYLGATLAPWILLIAMLLVGALIIIAYFAVVDRTHTGATTEVAGFLAFFLGVLSYQEEFTLAVILAVIITVILYARSMLHHFAQKIKESELSATVKFAVIALVILPFLPDGQYGPWEIFNPRLLWLMVVFISGISFAGYVLLKWLGQKGIVLTGILGGLASSTATTTSFAQRSATQKRIFRALALGVILANGVMFLRILLEVMVINPGLVPSLVVPLVSLAALTAIFSYVVWIRAKKTTTKIEVGSPFTIIPALKFAIIFAVILAVVKVAHVYLSARGVYLVSFISGLADVDAITVSLAQLAKGQLAHETARKGIVLAALTNMAVKGGIAWWLGGKEFRKIVAGFFAVLMVIGLLLLMFL